MSIIKDIQGYMEGVDITKVPPQNLAFPSKNCIVHKGTVITRKGITLYGSAGSTNLATHSEKVWKDSKSGLIPMRM